MPPFGWLLCLIAALAGTGWALRYAHRAQVFDHPEERSNHAQPTPRGGGIAMVAVMAGVLMWLASVRPSDRLVLLAMLGGLLLVAGIGWLDDHRPLSARLRLAVHVLAAVLVAIAAACSGWPAWSLVLALVAIPVLVNIWNFMDGTNGIAATQAMVWGFALLLWTPVALAGNVGLALAMACLGFLPFNFPRARIFMGDVGSGALGFLIAGSGLLLAREQGAPALGCLCVLAPFLVDAGLTLLRRIWRRERWWQAHSQHAYQRLARIWGSHAKVNGIYLMLASVGAILGWALRFRETTVTISLILLWYIGMAALWGSVQYGRQFSKGVGFDSVA
ncbi:MraY family glycosyltransferase [Solilutibacter silvestris]|uniref:UDP-N-acetylmuramyl pentapeptide phosphotransferase/UDP-N-acetylglucosamine-1-phosphate transferase n=1 Tax=Solilutibacter silvestris TaxID=1645665 RepID=A0A2K1PYK9_9GAMM|nr:glycosyltransferase family 4 protein [Lysobacter silvestris]PNS07869.1 UDP-N-acetylmuramyl pentapeptide phosphotransferase/UDP-N- acetylglucosamine-1-phosphate transferase [Lysobacter silvestris]